MKTIRVKLPNGQEVALPAHEARTLLERGEATPVPSSTISRAEKRGH